MRYYYKTVLFSVFIFFLTLFLIGVGFANAEEYEIKSKYDVLMEAP